MFNHTETAMTKTNKSVEELLAEAQAEITRLTNLRREEAMRKARFPWENPETVQEQPKVGYNLRMEPDLYLKAKWITENVGGFKSLQVFLDRAARKYADEIIEKHTAH
jgi:hypothetical protein